MKKMLLTAVLLLSGLSIRAAHIEVNRSSFILSVKQSTNTIVSFPIAVGRADRKTPRGTFYITQIVRHPGWYPNPKVRRDDPTVPKFMPYPSPLGEYWFGFSKNRTSKVAIYGIHGTPHEETIGQAVSYGCIRMYKHDLKVLSTYVKRGMRVLIY